MKKGQRNFWQRKQTLIAGTIMVAAAVLMTCMAVINRKENGQQQELAQRQESIAQEKKELETADNDSASDYSVDDIANEGAEDGSTNTAKANSANDSSSDSTAEEDAAQASAIVKPYGSTSTSDRADGKNTNVDQFTSGSGPDEKTASNNASDIANKNQEQIADNNGTSGIANGSADGDNNDLSTVNTGTTDGNNTGIADADSAATDNSTAAASSSNTKAAASNELHFAADTGLLWPLDGSVIMNYSMDQTIFFATLDQYKYNPAVIIAGAVNDKVKAAAAGTVTDISTNEETGCTLSMDIGDGYTAVYGQLKEVPYQVGEYVAAGNTIGFVSEPTKYYSVEGSNLFFELQKDGQPVDPVEFFQ